MPLLDHFHPPLNRRRHWESFHSAWANALRDQFNDVLPPRYFAEVQISLSRQVEADVATPDDTGGVAVWAPPRPPQTAVLPVLPTDVFEIGIFTDEEGQRLVGAVEFISPSDKDRPGHRHQFAVKCGSYVYAGVGLVMVAAVAHRTSNLHRELLELLGITAPPSAPDLYAGAYRTRPTPAVLAVDYWVETLTVGKPLPSLPLWLGTDFRLEVRLEQAYLAARASSRITQSAE